MIKFIYQWDDKSPQVTIAMSAESSLVECCETFESFLRVAGYHFDGHIVIGEE